MSTAQSKPQSRLLFIDNLRVFLTILVILHHFMITYAGTGDWYYNEGRQDFITMAIGGWFCSVNQAYFMGLFLLISAYFVPGSYDRKGAVRFLKDRLIRLGIPLAAFSWIINPLFIYLGLMVTGEASISFWEYFPRIYFQEEALIGAGPLWFVEVLLIFSLLYVLWRIIFPNPPEPPVVETRFPSNLAIALFALLLGIAGFLVRLWKPIGWGYAPLNLQFPFFVQYIALFIIGLVAYRRNWLLGLPDKTGRQWLWIAVLMIILWAPMMLLGGALENESLFGGGWTWQALAYALWESFTCFSMSIGVVYLFRRYLNQRGRAANFLVPNAYTAYIIHAPIIVTLAFSLSGVTFHPLLKYLLLAPVAVGLCFGIGSLMRKIPYTDRVL